MVTGSNPACAFGSKHDKFNQTLKNNEFKLRCSMNVCESVYIQVIYYINRYQSRGRGVLK